MASAASAAIVLSGCLAFGGLAFADADSGTSVSPFIDSLKKEMKDGGQPSGTGDGSQPYIDSVKKNLEPEKTDGSFIDHVKGENPAFFNKAPDGSYTDKIKTEIGPGQPGGAIQAVEEGHSELHPRKQGEATAAFGLDFTTLINPDFTASNASQPFNKVYPKWTPDVAFTYEKRILRFWSGQLALTASFGGTYNNGFGIFKYQLVNYNVTPNSNFLLTSSTSFQFITVPLAAGINYRMSGLKYVQPYFSIAPELVPYAEFRNDGGTTHYGDSRCVATNIGVWFQMDWVSKSADWDLYVDYGIQHYYLALLYQNVTNITGGVDFSTNGVTVGLTFEY